MGLGGQTQVSRLGRKSLFLASHLAGPHINYFNEYNFNPIGPRYNFNVAVIIFTQVIEPIVLHTEKRHFATK